MYLRMQDFQIQWVRNREWCDADAELDVNVDHDGVDHDHILLSID